MVILPGTVPISISVQCATGKRAGRPAARACSACGQSIDSPLNAPSAGGREAGRCQPRPAVEHGCSTYDGGGAGSVLSLPYPALTSWIAYGGAVLRHRRSVRLSPHHHRQNHQSLLSSPACAARAAHSEKDRPRYPRRGSHHAIGDRDVVPVTAPVSRFHVAFGVRRRAGATVRKSAKVLTLPGTVMTSTRVPPFDVRRHRQPLPCG